MTKEGGGKVTITASVGNPIKDAVPEGWHLVGEAASLIGRSKDTLKRWHAEEVLIPSGTMDYGQLEVPLYSEDDIKEGRRIARTMKPGRKPNHNE
jgi:hypothetical protein